MIRSGTGWIPDFPDAKDYTPDSEKVKPLLTQVGAAQPDLVNLPTSVDLRAWFPPIYNQGRLQSCTANTTVALLEYFQKRSFGTSIGASRLFLYKVARNILLQTGDRGAFLRTAMGTLKIFGVPPEEYWPYDESRVDVEPPAFCYSFAENYKAVNYYRYDPPGTSKDELLKRIKTHLAANLPSMFGFYMFASISQADKTGRIPYPVPGESPTGLHAMTAVGYDDTMQIQNANSGGPRTQGALLIRNSWGPEWGDSGYGWLPYDYVLNGLAEDWWSLIQADWINTKEFAVGDEKSKGSTLPFLNQVGVPITDSLKNLDTQVGAGIPLLADLGEYAGSYSIGPLTIQYRISLAATEISISVDLLDYKVGEANLSPSNASTTIAQNIGIAKAEVTLTADFDNQTLKYDAKACFRSGFKDWKCKQYTGVFDSWKLTKQAKPDLDSPPSRPSVKPISRDDLAQAAAEAFANTAALAEISAQAIQATVANSRAALEITKETLQLATDATRNVAEAALNASLVVNKDIDNAEQQINQTRAYAQKAVRNISIKVADAIVESAQTALKLAAEATVSMAAASRASFDAEKAMRAARDNNGEIATKARESTTTTLESLQAARDATIAVVDAAKAAAEVVRKWLETTT